MKWSFVPKNNPKPKYLVCNADESEPGTFKDRLLMEKDPSRHRRRNAYCRRLRDLTHTAFIYIRGELAFGAKVLEQAVEEATELATSAKIYSDPYDVDLIVHRGAGAYICGEETALLSSLEGGRGWLKALSGNPWSLVARRWLTMLKTLAALPWIIEHGAAAYGHGNGKEQRHQALHASGHIRKPGVYELRWVIRS